MPTITHTITAYLDMVLATRSKKTLKSYRSGLNKFAETLRGHGLDPDKADVTELHENAVGWFAEDIAYMSPASVALYMTAVRNLFEYILGSGLSTPNMSRIGNLIRQRSRRPGQRLPQFPASDIDKLLEMCEDLKRKPSDDPAEHLRNLRDRAFLLTLADTGLRVAEACALKRGDIDMQEMHAVIIGKGDKQAVVRFSKRAIDATKDYLTARAARDGNTGRPLPSLPIFARHDRGAGKVTKPMQMNTGRAIVNDRVEEFLGEAAKGTITPHSFRHYFVTRVLQSSGNLKLAQKLARHESIAVTQRYAHLSDDELDAGYYDAIESSSPAPKPAP